ncbi:O-antigen ligase family protein [Niallia oryzisoli]|uniref:O-antigen ligase family protein n=1 Tax=Niallia oryzisoli TaxID=1737571 RepID=UPI0037354BC9
MQWFIFIFLAIIFIVTPYQRGLYFTAESYGTYFIIISLMLLLIVRHLLIKKETYSLKTVLLVLLLPISYLLSLPVAESPMGAMDSVIKWLAYSSFFLLLYWVSFKPAVRKWLSPIFILTGTLISLFMLMVYWGTYDYHDAVLNSRFAGVFQYPNTFAMVMAVYYLFCLLLMTKKGSSILSYLVYAIPLIPFFICFIQASSRGMILILPLLWFIGLVMLSVKRQIEYITYTIITVGCSLLLNYLLFSKNVGVAASIAVILLSAALNIGMKYLFYRKNLQINFFTRKGMQFVLPATAIIFSVAAMLDLRYKGLLYRVLPDHLQDRISEISLQAGTAQERFIFFRDALRMSKDSPFIGFGGEGWATVYSMYQQTPYLSNKVHNGYLEWLLDTGWVGFIIFFIVFGYLLHKVFQGYKQAQDKSMSTAVVIALLTIAVHSFIDFNFSFGTVWLMVMWLLVMGIPEQDGSHEKSFFRMSEVNQKRMVTITLSIFAILVVVGIISSFRYMQAVQYADEARQTTDSIEKISVFEKAIDYHPKNVTYQMNLSDFYLHRMRENPELDYRKELEDMAADMVQLEPHHSIVLQKAAGIQAQLGNKKEALALLDKALEVDHYNTQLYEQSMKLKLEMARMVPDQKQQWAKAALVDYQQFSQWEAAFQQQDLSKEYNSRDFGITSPIAYYTGLSYYLLGQPEKVVELYSRYNHLKDDSKIKALMILALKSIDDDQHHLYSLEGNDRALKETVEQLRGL